MTLKRGHGGASYVVLQDASVVILVGCSLSAASARTVANATMVAGDIVRSPVMAWSESSAQSGELFAVAFLWPADERAADIETTTFDAKSETIVSEPLGSVRLPGGQAIDGRLCDGVSSTSGAVTGVSCGDFATAVSLPLPQVTRADEAIVDVELGCVPADQVTCGWTADLDDDHPGEPVIAVIADDATEWKVNIPSVTVVSRGSNQPQIRVTKIVLSRDAPLPD